MGKTAPSLAGLRNLLECQLVASGPVSASPSPTTQAEGGELGYALSHAYGAAFDNPDLIEPGVSGATWLGMPPGNENWVKRRFMPSSSGEMFG
jgi:xylulose-5-phosphate/fructose-6-phosphate phosphoketolase